MPPSLGEAVLHLVGDDSQLQKDVDGARGKVSSSLKEIGGAMTSAGKKVTLGLTLPIMGIGGAAVKEASDLQEGISAANTVFEDSAGIVLEFGETAATSVGLARSEFNQMATETGALLMNMGQDQEEAAEESTNLTERAADMAAVFNTDVSQAMNAVQAGLRGQSIPLRQYGVDLSKAAIANKAVEMGLAESASEMDKNAEAQAALALFYEQTNQIAGFFKDESDSVANSLRILKAQTKDEAAALGLELLPVVLEVLKVVRDLVTRFGNLSPQVKKNIVIIGAVVAAIGPLLVILGTLISSIGTIIGAFSTLVAVVGGPVLLVIAAVVAAVALLALAWKNDWLGMKTTLTKLWNDTLQPIFSRIMKWLKIHIPAAIQTLKHFWLTVLKPAIEIVWGFVRDHLLPLMMALGEFLEVTLGLALTILAGVWQNVLQPALEDIWEFISDKLQPIFEKLHDFWENTLQPALAKIEFLEILHDHLDRVGEGIQEIIDFIKTLTEKLRKIELPDWMTPGSPTPWEIGLLGVSDAMKKVANVQTSLEMGLSGLSPASVAVPGSASASPGAASIVRENHYHIGVLVADERGLRELEGRLRSIRDVEDERRGTG